jgi:hypothetical protein
MQRAVVRSPCAPLAPCTADSARLSLSRIVAAAARSVLLARRLSPALLLPSPRMTQQALLRQRLLAQTLLARHTMMQRGRGRGSLMQSCWRLMAP